MHLTFLNTYGVMGNGFKSIIPREDMVEVNVFVEEDICPNGLGEAGAISLDDERMLCSPEIDKEIHSESESVGNTQIKGLRWDPDISPQIHGFIGLSSSTIFLTDREGSIS